MHNEIKGIRRFLGLIVILLPLLSIPTLLYGGAPDNKPETPSKIHGNYVLKVKGDQISLKAMDASLKDILEEIGRKMNIEVIALIPEEEKITTDFDMMYLGDAIKRFKTNYAYITTSGKEKGKISKIVAVPEGEGKELPQKYEYHPQPPLQNQDQQFYPPIQEYNPQPPAQKDDHEPQSTSVKSDNNSQSSPTATEYESQSTSATTGNESRSTSTTTVNESQSTSTTTGNESQSTPTTTENESQSTPTTTGDETQPPDVGSGYNPQPSMQ